MDPDVYLRKHHLLTYVEDAVVLLLGRKDEDSKTKPFELLADYFKSVQTGSHVVFREYNFICATPHNRKSFISTFWQTYQSVAECSEAMRTVEYHSLLRLLCTDFPLEITQRVPRALFGHDATGSIISFVDFTYTFQVTFYFEYFFSQLQLVYPNLLSGTYHPALYPQFSSTTVVVPLPPASSDANHPPLYPQFSSTTVVVPLPPASSDANSRPNTAQQRPPLTAPSDTYSKPVAGGVLMEAALELCQRMSEREPGLSCPSEEAVREVLSGVDRLSLHDFALKLSLSKLVNSEIGALPDKT